MMLGPIRHSVVDAPKMAFSVFCSFTTREIGSRRMRMARDWPEKRSDGLGRMRLTRDRPEKDEIECSG
jgi:hypothetical protein